MTKHILNDVSASNTWDWSSYFENDLILECCWHILNFLFEGVDKLFNGWCTCTYAFWISKTHIYQRIMSRCIALFLQKRIWAAVLIYAIKDFDHENFKTSTCTDRTLRDNVEKVKVNPPITKYPTLTFIAKHTVLYCPKHSSILERLSIICTLKTFRHVFHLSQCTIKRIIS